MTNYDGIIRMTPDELEAFLEQVHLRGLIIGGYAVRTGFDWEMEASPFNAAWLAEEAEKAVEIYLENIQKNTEEQIGEE